MSKQKKVGLALGSGGLRGLAHIGVLKVLTTEGIPIDFLAGSSAGAIAAAYFAVHGEVEGLEELALRMRKMDFARLVDLISPRKALIKGQKIQKFLDKLFEESFFSQLKIPLTIVATDLRTGREIYLTSGRVAEAVMASMTLPGALPPVALGKNLLVDGGVVNPTPVDVVRKMGAGIVIGVDLTMTGKVYACDPNIVETLLRSFEVLKGKTPKLTAARIGKSLVLIKPHIRGSFRFLAYFEHREEMIKEGERATRQVLPKIKKLLGR
jgi:NTE family protein